MAKTDQKTGSTSSDRSISLPLLIETVFTLSKLTVVLVGIIVVVVSFANGNPYWMAMLRGGVTVLVLGLIVWFLSWFSAKGVIESARSMLKEADEAESAAAGNNMDTNV
jgi:hypothetical protein